MEEVGENTDYFDLDRAGEGGSRWIDDSVRGTEDAKGRGESSYKNGCIGKEEKTTSCGDFEKNCTRAKGKRWE